jgi:hypothetical protein
MEKNVSFQRRIQMKIDSEIAPTVDVHDFVGITNEYLFILFKILKVIDVMTFVYIIESGIILSRVASS